MTDARSTWSDAGERLTALGSSLKAHYRQQRGSDAEQTREELNDAVRKLTSAVQDAFEAVGAAAKDPEVKDEVKKVGQTVGQALGVTFSEVSEDLRRAFAQRKGDVTAPPADGGTGTTTEPTGTTGLTTGTTTEPTGTTGPATGATTGAAGAPQASAPEPPAPGETRQDGEEPPRVEPWGTP